MMSIRKSFCAIFLCLTALIILYIIDLSANNRELVPTKDYHNEFKQSLGVKTIEHEKSRSHSVTKLPTLTITFVLCGDRFQEALVLVKSAIVFQLKYPLKFFIFSEDQHKLSLEDKLSDWQVLKNHTFTFEILNLQFPKGHEQQWKSLFKKCACQRLFIPDILQDVDAILYMDVDTLFLGPVYNVWQIFDRLNSTQITAVANETDDTHSSWYNRFAKHPFYGKTGLNSGVMLMNLTRMRQFGWGSYLAPIYNEFKKKLILGDQDVINIIFSYHPEAVYVMPCRYNYRTDYCRYMPVCPSANKDGALVLHGSRISFVTDKAPAFRAIFLAFHEYQLGQNIHERIILQLKPMYLPEDKSSPCGLNFKQIFLKEMEQIYQPWGI